MRHFAVAQLRLHLLVQDALDDAGRHLCLGFIQGERFLQPLPGVPLANGPWTQQI